MRTEPQVGKPGQTKRTMKIGVLSDTHGHIEKQVIDILTGTDLILHAGDVDSPDLLKTLKKAGQVIAVRGNMDFGAWTQDIPTEDFVDVGGIRIYLVHDLNQISLDPAAANIRIVISGHTHRPAIHKKQGVLYLNPGSASFPRGGVKASMALIEIDDGQMKCRHIEV
jgi:putative phosphoesterase